MKAEQTQSERHEQTIVMREQILAYREVLDGIKAEGVGSALAVNMLGVSH